MTVVIVETNLPKSRAQRSWALGPLISALFITSDLKIQSITLSPSKTFSCEIQGKGLENQIFKWMENYAMRQKVSTPLPLDLSMYSRFMQKGLSAISKIKWGDVKSYGEIASHIGCAKGARAIGNVCNKNPFPLVIPCHRVVSKSGGIGGFAYDISMKKALLDHES